MRPHNERGDLILTLPALKGFRKADPKARITLVGGPKHRQLAPCLNMVDRFLVLDKGLFSFLRMVQEIREPKPDLAVCLSTVSVSATSTFLTALSGARITAGRVRGTVTAEPEIRPFLDILFPSQVPGRHQSDLSLDFLGALERPTGETALPLLVVPEGNEKQARDIFGQTGLKHRAPLVYLHVGAGKEANRWPSLLWARLGDLLWAELNASLLINISPGDEGQIEKVVGQMRARPVVTPGAGLLDSAAQAAGCHLFIGNDTGMLHVAAAFGVPTIGLYGPTRPEEWAPPSPRHRSLSGEKGEIGLITPEEVLRAARIALRIAP